MKRVNIELDLALQNIEEFKKLIFDQLGVLIDVEDYQDQEGPLEVALVAARLNEFLEQYLSAEDEINTHFQDKSREDPSLGGILNTSLANKVLTLVEEIREQEELITALESEMDRINSRLIELTQSQQDSQEEVGLSKYQSQFLENLLDIIEGLEGVEIVGDRFVFSTEILFATSEAVLSVKGKEEIKKVGQIILDLEIPQDARWVLQVDGHTDNQPIIPGGEFEDNWELSQARALSVVKFLIKELNFPQNKLAATGYGEYQPVDLADTVEGRAKNRRIELKLTEP